MHFEPITYLQSKTVEKYKTPTVYLEPVIKMSTVILSVSDVMTLAANVILMPSSKLNTSA